MKYQKQRISDKGIGDCFPACMATLLELPIEVLPNDHSEAWYGVWEAFLAQFGLSISFESSGGAIWQIHPWIASVNSKNYKNTTHAIIMHEDSKVLFDPSPKKVYKIGEDLLQTDCVRGGYKITVSDFTKLHKLKEYRDKLQSFIE